MSEFGRGFKNSLELVLEGFQSENRTEFPGLMYGSRPCRVRRTRRRASGR